MGCERTEVTHRFGFALEPTEAELEGGRRVDAQHDHGPWLGAIAMTGDDGRGSPIHDVVRGIEERVDPPPPWRVDAVGDGRQLELERLPVRVQNGVEGHAMHRELRREGNAVRRRAPVRLVELDAVPGDVGLPDDLAQRLSLIHI